MVFFKEAFSPPPQATGVNCSAQSDLAQLKARQSDVRTLHPEDMMQDDVLVSTLLAQRPPPPDSGKLQHIRKCLPVWPELQPLVVHGGRVRGPAASERTGRRRARQPQSSRGLFQTSESAGGAEMPSF